MLVRELGDSLLLITQADHARLAADLLALVRVPELVAHPRRDHLLRAVADHDNGWWESDAAPRVGSDGSPVAFLGVARAERCEIWERGIERFARSEPYRAALVAAHALRLHAERRGEPGWQEFLAHLEARRDELAEAAGIPLEQLAGDDRWTALADGLSLALCLADAGFVDAAGWRARIEVGSERVTLGLEPFPLAGATRLEVRGRTIPARRYASDSELALTLAAARWERRSLRVAPFAA